MPTRCQLRFIERTPGPTASDRPVQLSRGRDGDPRAIVATLGRLARLVRATGTLGPPGEVAAQFLFLSMVETMDLYVGPSPDWDIRAETPEEVLEPRRWAHLQQPLFLTDHSVVSEGAVRGDEAYLYVVEVPPLANLDLETGWRLRVSGPGGFPSEGDGLAEAFERASWTFEGSLAAALDRFVKSE